MALEYEQYATIVETTNGNEAQVPGDPLGANAAVSVAVGASSARSTVPFDDLTKFLILTSDVDARFEIGDSTVTADSSSRRIFAGTYREVRADGSTHIAVIQA